MTGKLEVMTEGTIEASVTVDQGQVLEQVPIGTELDVLSVENMIPNNASRQRGRANTTNVQHGQRLGIATDAINRYISGQMKHKYYGS